MRKEAHRGVALWLSAFVVGLALPARSGAYP